SRHRMIPVRPTPRAAEIRFAFFYLTAFALFGVYMPYFQRLLRLRGFHEEEIGFIVATIEAVGIVAPPAWGWFSHRVPFRRLLIAAALLGSGGIFLAFGQVTAHAAALALAAGYGFFYRPIIPLADGLRLRYMAEHGGDYGRLRALGSLAFTAPIITLEILGVAGEDPRRLVVGAAVTCAVLGASAALTLPLTSAERAERLPGAAVRPRFAWSLFARKPFVALAIVAFLHQIGVAAFYGFFTLYLEDTFSYRPAGYLWILAPLSETPVIYFSTAIIARIGVRNLLALGIGTAVVRLLGYALAPSVGWVIPLQLLHALTFGGFYTASIHYIHRLSPPHMKQGALAVYSACSLGTASIAGNALGGILVYHVGFRAMFAAMSILSLASVVLLFFLIDEPEEADPAT
ncbi:MAG: MFS transporter, partial [Planctomycetes bacterium]|nr:MFS transporter [Planctomycetota bacterium]